MNFNDGDIARYYLPTLVATAPLVGVAVAMVAATSARAAAEASRRVAGLVGRRRIAVAVGSAALALALLLPLATLVANYQSSDESANRDADRWVESVYAALPPNAVIISWWSYSTPLWYHRWVLGERPDVTIIDERNIIDDGYGTIDGAIHAFLGRRPVYVLPPDWEVQQILVGYPTRSVPTYSLYPDIYEIKEVSP
jgi:hypothetical protein